MKVKVMLFVLQPYTGINMHPHTRTYCIGANSDNKGDQIKIAELVENINMDKVYSIIDAEQLKNQQDLANIEEFSINLQET